MKDLFLKHEVDVQVQENFAGSSNKKNSGEKKEAPKAIIYWNQLPKNSKDKKAKKISWKDVLVSNQKNIDAKTFVSLEKSVEGELNTSCEPGEFICWNTEDDVVLVLANTPASKQKFSWLTMARTIVGEVQKLKKRHCLHLKFNTTIADKNEIKNMIEFSSDAILSAWICSMYEAPSYKKSKNSSKKKEEKKSSLSFLVEIPNALKERRVQLQKDLKSSLISANATNFVKVLSDRYANDLTPKTYVQLCKDLAKANGLGFEFYDYKRLEKMGAGAFIAVAQGSSHQDGGIVKLIYKGSSKKQSSSPTVCFVGKGITYDTGGTNVKPARYMFGMHKDMGGSALALAMILLASTEKWDFDVQCFLAITDNAIGSKAFRPNEIVHSLSGLSIETVHTDAEGRMILADTLCLASKENSKLILDYATLTGSCVRAIGTNYSGVFTNRSKLHSKLIKAGKQSGERVWPFPLSSDYGDCLKSEQADTKQCRLSEGPDHIEAAIFLKKFVSKKVDWVHVDLAASEHEGGLAHVGGLTTGFGVRFSKEFIRLYLGADV